MENPSPASTHGPAGGADRHYKRVRRRRPPSLAERLIGFIANPRLPRRQRNERIAILAAILIVGLYMLVSPIMSRYFPGAPPKSAPAARTPAKSKSAFDPGR